MKVKKNIVSAKGTGVKYLIYRIMRPLLKLNYSLYKLGNKNTPWLAQETVEFLKSNLKKDMVGLEYGSGFSTSFLADRSKLVVSIEHNKEWFDKIEAMIEENNIKNIQYIYSAENDPCDKSIDQVVKILKEVDDFPFKTNFLSYIDQVNQFEDNYFDYVIIDGRARVESFLASFEKLKKGGYMILDNSERPRYQVLQKFMTGKKKFYHTTGLTDTIIWVK